MNRRKQRGFSQKLSSNNLDDIPLIVQYAIKENLKHPIRGMLIRQRKLQPHSYFLKASSQIKISFRSPNSFEWLEKPIGKRIPKKYWVDWDKKVNIQY